MDKEKLRARILAEPDVDCEAGVTPDNPVSTERIPLVDSLLAIEERLQDELTAGEIVTLQTVRDRLREARLKLAEVERERDDERIVKCNRCGHDVSIFKATPEEGDQWECFPCNRTWDRLERAERALQPVRDGTHTIVTATYLKHLEAENAGLRDSLRALVDETHVMVPREPTPAMVQAGNKRHIYPRFTHSSDVVKDVYRAMLAAAKGTPEAEEKGNG